MFVELLGCYIADSFIYSFDTGYALLFWHPIKHGDGWNYRVRYGYEYPD